MNWALNDLEIERRSIAMYKTELRVSYAHHTVSDLHFATVYGLKTDLGGCKIPKFSGGGGGMPPYPLTISFCTSLGSSYKRSACTSVPMLCPSNGDVLAMPLT